MLGLDRDPRALDDRLVLDPATMTTAQLLAWEREVARLEWVALLRAETVFEPTPAPEWVAFVPPATSLEEWASGS